MSIAAEKDGGRVTRWQGVAGTATRVTAPKLSPDQEATLSSWLIHAPGQAPVWEHYILGIIHLRLIEGVRPAAKTYPAAEYEILLAALDPARKPDPVDAQTLVPLRPLNFEAQFDGVSDEQAVEICERFARAVVDGMLPAEFEGLKGAKHLWHQTLDRTLEHYKTGGHESKEG